MHHIPGIAAYVLVVGFAMFQVGRINAAIGRAVTVHEVVGGITDVAPLGK